MDDPKTLHILVNAYACSPEWGSEVGMGWNWVCALSKSCRLDVITEAGFAPAIEKAIDNGVFKDSQVRFHYIDIGERGRRLFWNQGSWGFYYFYRKWQLQAYKLAEKLLKEQKFDVVHQLNMVGFREPGYLWKLKGIPFLWGPVCGMGQVPYKFIATLDLKNRVKYCIKNVINTIQQYTSSRVAKAARRADMIFAVTGVEQAVFRDHYGKESVIFPEVGTGCGAEPVKHSAHDGALRFCWCGVMEGRKALNIVLHALAECKKENIPFVLDIIGDGPCREQWYRLCSELDLQSDCVWHGRLPHEKSLEIMRNSDIFLMSSWKEATSTVVNEALSLGVGVFCHDTCGMGLAINDTCGMKIPLSSPDESIKGFAGMIKALHLDRDKIRQFSEGAYRRASELSWENSARRMVENYREAVEKYQDAEK